MHYENTTFVYDNEFKEHMKVKEAFSVDIFDYRFDVGAGKFLSEKGKKYLLELFEKWDSEHLQFDEDFDDYLDIDRLKNIIGDEANKISIWMTSFVSIALRALKSCCTTIVQL